MGKDMHKTKRWMGGTVLLSQCCTREPVRSKLREEGLISVSSRVQSMTAGKSQWGGLEVAAPYVSVVGRQRGMLLFILLRSVLLQS